MRHLDRDLVFLVPRNGNRIRPSLPAATDPEDHQPDDEHRTQRGSNSYPSLGARAE